MDLLFVNANDTSRAQVIRRQVRSHVSRRQHELRRNAKGRASPDSRPDVQDESLNTDAGDIDSPRSDSPFVQTRASTATLARTNVPQRGTIVSSMIHRPSHGRSEPTSLHNPHGTGISTPSAWQGPDLAGPPAPTFAHAAPEPNCHHEPATSTSQTSEHDYLALAKRRATKYQANVSRKRAPNEHTTSAIPLTRPLESKVRHAHQQSSRYTAESALVPPLQFSLRDTSDELNEFTYAVGTSVPAMLVCFTYILLASQV